MQPDAPIVVASVQKLARPENLARLAGQTFGYVVVDEVHHAHAPTYRRVLDALDPGFLLGLTATPDRADEGDILGLFDDFLAYRADLGAGIARKRLVPFAYQGLRDEIDYAQIPWRNRRFDPDALAAAVQTQRRMQRLWQAWTAHPASRTLVFCCSIASGACDPSPPTPRPIGSSCCAEDLMKPDEAGRPIVVASVARPGISPRPDRDTRPHQ